MEQQMSLKDVAALLGVKAYRVEYLLKSGKSGDTIPIGNEMKSGKSGDTEIGGQEMGGHDTNYLRRTRRAGHFLGKVKVWCFDYA
jgi:hypothetical protein